MFQTLYDETWPAALEVEGWSLDDLCFRNRESREHTLRVAKLTVALAEMAGISGSEITYVRHGALLHDVGHVGIPDNILLKPGTLTTDEWNVICKHPRYAYELIYPVEYLKPCVSIPYSHHEKWDGTGYPQGLKGNEIPLAARLFAIVDVWDRLSTNRIYRAAWPIEKVLEYLQRQSERHFDPQVVELFLRVIDKMLGTDIQLPLAE